MTDLEKLNELIIFSEEGTLSKAAERVYRSQPVLTREMKALEEELGLSLFNRTKNRMVLNETGLKVVGYAKQLLDSEKEFIEKVQSYKRSLTTINIGFCAPVPQEVLTPYLNNVFLGMTISSDMKDDSDFEKKLISNEYQLAVLHYLPSDDRFFGMKIGSEQLFLQTVPSSSLAFYPRISLLDLENKTLLLYSDIGFWKRRIDPKVKDVRFLTQIDRQAFEELATYSGYPSFASDFYMKRNADNKRFVYVPFIDEECITDYYLVCLKENKKKYEPLFSHLNERTIS